MINNKHRVYTQLTLHEHVLQRPNIYIGNIESEPTFDFIYNEENNQIVKKKFNTNYGLIKIISEIIENATDESIRSRSCTVIKVNVTKDEISVMNNGNGISITLQEGKDMYIPQFLFSELLTSSNYVDQQDDNLIGVNGIGAKATNIFSKEFKIEIVNTIQKKKYTQNFKNNMYDIEKPIITDTDEKRGYAKFTFKPDFEKFGMTCLSDDLINLLYKKIIDVSLCSKKNLKVYFNNNHIKVKTLEEYIKLYYPTVENESKIITELENEWKIGVVYIPDNEFQQVSFVNGAITMNGGTHVNFIIKKITDYLTEKIKVRLTTNNKKDNKNSLVKQSYIESNLSIFVIANVNKPQFDSQSKTTLKSRITDKMIQIPDSFLKQIEDTGIVENVINFIKIKTDAELKKTDGKKSRKVDVDKYLPANKAGGPYSHKCRLIITEGDSAKSFAVRGRETIGCDYYGVFPIRGKMLNVRDVAINKITRNQEITSIKKIIGLEQGKVYDTESVKKLNYGGILILTDQDLDGYHIKGLIINFIHSFWRELCQIDGFFQTLQTPILKATYGRQQQIFYNEQNYKEWESSIGPEINKWTIKYYKGLGTSKPEEVDECFADFDNKLISFTWEDIKLNVETAEKIACEFIDANLSATSAEENVDINNEQNINMTTTTTTTTTPSLSDNLSGAIKIPKRKKRNEKIDKHKCIIDDPTISDDAITLAFSKDRVQDRKEWLKEYKSDNILIVKDQKISYSDFINKELIHFSNDDNIRSIPSIWDGLKPSQRKILFTVLECPPPRRTGIKVANLASKVSDRTNYAHGENSLAGAIINMAQQFPGSNNINLLYPNGAFGTLMKGGEDAAATRYIFTSLDNLTRLIFRKEDDIILKTRVEENKEVEPENYYGIVPMCLINGVKGIGTGFSTDIPAYNPIDIIDNLLLMIDDKDEQKVELIPWYNGHKGTIERYNHCTYISHAKYVIDNKNNRSKIKISELPVGVWWANYEIAIKEKDKKLKENNMIKNIKNNSGSNTVNIEITLEPGKLQELIRNDILEKELGLYSIIKTSNMMLYNSNGKLELYNGPDDVMVDFYNRRSRLYKIRKALYLRIINNQLKLINWKKKFIEDYLNGTILIAHKTKAEVIAQLIKLGYPKLSPHINAIDENDVKNDNDIETNEHEHKIPIKTYNYITDLRLFALTKDEYEKLTCQFNDKQIEYNNYEKTTWKDLWKQELIELKNAYIKWVPNVLNSLSASGSKNKKKL